VDEPADSFDPGAIDSLLSRATRNNTSMRQAWDNLKAAEALAKGAGWNQLPTLDLVGSLGGTGLAGDARQVVFGGDTLLVDVTGGYGDAMSSAISRDFPNWSVGLELTLPLFRDEGRGARRQLRAEVERARAQVAATGRALEEQVRSVYRELSNGRTRLEIAREGLAASLEQVRIGVIEFDNGRATAFELVRLAADLATAQERLSEALVRTETAAAELRYLTGEAPDNGNQE
jgi:outer membrane protein TolC